MPGTDEDLHSRRNDNRGRKAPVVVSPARKDVQVWQLSIATPVITAITPGIVITFFPGDMPVQSVKVTVNPLPLPRAEMTVISHAVDFVEDPVQFTKKPPGLMPRECTPVNTPVNPFACLLDPGAYPPAPLPAFSIP